jgi:hypothetical protein
MRVACRDREPIQENEANVDATSGHSSSQGTWLPDVIAAYRAAGGTARFPKIQKWIQRYRPNLPINWEAVIRATVYHHSSDSPAFRVGDPDVFVKKSHGLWGLRHASGTIFGKSDNDLFGQVLLNMSKGEIESYAGRGELFREHVDSRVNELKRKYCIC